MERRLDERMKSLEATSVERRAILDLAGQLAGFPRNLGAELGDEPGAEVSEVARFFWAGGLRNS